MRVASFWEGGGHCRRTPLCVALLWPLGRVAPICTQSSGFSSRRPTVIKWPPAVCQVRTGPGHVHSFEKDPLSSQSLRVKVPVFWQYEIALLGRSANSRASGHGPCDGLVCDVKTLMAFKCGHRPVSGLWDGGLFSHSSIFVTFWEDLILVLTLHSFVIFYSC